MSIFNVPTRWASTSSDVFDIYPCALQNWSKKGSGEKGRGGGSKLPPRFAKRQQQQQGMAATQQQPSAPAAQTPSVPQQPQPQPAIAVSQHNLSASNQSTSSPQPLDGAVAPLPPASLDFPSKIQTHNTLGTELWENKVAGSTVLSDVKKRKLVSLILFAVCEFSNMCWMDFFEFSWTYQPSPASLG